jgi:alpha-glucosidase
MKRWLGVMVLCCAACGEDAAPPAPFDLATGSDLRVTVEQGNRLVIRAGDGRVLLDGLPPGTVAAYEPPLVGFAVRDVSTSYEMQFGAFKPTDDERGPWRAANRLVDASNDAGAALALLKDGVTLATLRFTAVAPGHLAIATELASAGPRLSWGFRCDADDHFAGFGAQSWDVDHRGQIVPTFVHENGIGKAEHDEYTGAWFAEGRRHSSHMPIPQYLSRRGYVLTTETRHRSIFALCAEREDAARVEVEIGATVHVFDGPTPPEALERASGHFGRPRMPPRVAFAPWLDATMGSAEVRRVAQKLRDEGVPSSVIWTEDWRGGFWENDSYKLEEEWEVDRDLYPDFELVADELHALGFDFHIYFNPFIYQSSKAWAEVQQNGWLVKREDGSDYVFPGAKFDDTGLIDVFHEGARAWAVDRMRDGIALGADGWMNDFAEWLPTDAVTAAGSGADLHNEYPVAWQQIAREAIDGVNDGVERLFFGRSGWFGTPELADVIWAGDQRTTLDVDDGLPTIIPIGVGLGLCGVSTYGHDIAGYQAATNPGSTKEVFFRWTSLGAWSPVMRTHHGNQPLLNWNWEKDAETIAHFARYAAIHIALAPFFEGLAKVAHDSGLPIWRALAIHYPEDAAVWPIADQVLVGRDILLAPVQAEGATSRSVYLPTGRWYAWEGGALEGGQNVDASAAIDAIPVFARAGAIVPMYPDGVMTLTRSSAQVRGPESVVDDRVIRVFLGDDGAFTEAGGLSYRLDHLADASGALSMRFNGALLAACGAPPCADGDSAQLIGNGSLIIATSEDVAELIIEGGSDSRALRIEVTR